MFIRENAGFYLALLVLSVMLIIPGCNRDDEMRDRQKLDDPLAPMPAVTTSVSGVVIDERGQPIEGAVVEVQGSVEVTGFDGTFLFDEIEVPGNRCVVSANKDGYFAGIRGLVPVKDAKTDTRIVLMEKKVTHNFTAASGIDAQLPDGSAVKIEPASLMLPSGTPYSGNVNMSAVYLDPTAGNFGHIVPGGDMIARREDQSSSILYSYGILRVEMWSDAGEKLQVIPGKLATLTMNIPDAQRSAAPATIPLWYFDEEQGFWQEEGSATRTGNAYIGTVGHFTDWNCDIPEETATVIGRLVDCNGNPAWGTIEFGQITSDPQVTGETGEYDGKFKQRVPARIQTTIVLTDPLMITPLTKNGRGKVIVIVPPLAPEQVYDVGDIKVFPCPVDVTATIKTNTGDQVYSINYSTQTGNRVQHKPGPNLRAALPPDTEIKLGILTFQGVYVEKTITTVNEGGEMDLGIIDATRNLVESEAVIRGKTLCHGLPETQGQVSVHWETESGTTSNYTMPSADGTFVINAPNSTPVTVRSVTPGGTWERKFTTPQNPGEVYQVGTIEICDNAAVGETSFVVNGDGMADSLFQVVTNQNSQGFNSATYYPSQGVTHISIYSITQNMYLNLTFPGQAAGVPDLGLTFAIIEREVPSGSRVYIGGQIYQTQLEVTITKYDEVGGVVEGTFSGIFKIGDILSTETVTITEGKFSALRYEDGF